jgi:hypothetical protein
LFVCGYVGQVARPRGSKLKGQHQHQQTSKQKRKNREKNYHKNRCTVMLKKEFVWKTRQMYQIGFHRLDLCLRYKNIHFGVKYIKINNQ